MTQKLEAAAASGKPINMEAVFNQLTLDVIGKAVFNYDFQSLTTDSPIIQVRTRPASMSLLMNVLWSHSRGYPPHVRAELCVCVCVCVCLCGQAVYTALKETETRATDVLPYWKVGALGS
jgi:carotene epsilon-monooxygenase